MELPSKVERNVTNHGDETWFEYSSEPLFDDETLDRIRRRFTEMRDSDYERIATVKSSSSYRTKIRTKDLDNFKDDLREARRQWVEEHGDRLTLFGNAYYGDVLTEYEVVEVKEEKPRKTVVGAEYDASYSTGIGGAKYKKQQILLPIRSFEQWSYHTEVVEPLFEEYNEKYPY